MRRQGNSFPFPLTKARKVQANSIPHNLSIDNQATAKYFLFITFSQTLKEPDIT